MSIAITPQTIELGFKLARLGLEYLESRGKKTKEMSEGELVDTVEEAIAEFEKLNVPEPYDPFKSERVDEEDITGDPI